MRSRGIDATIVFLFYNTLGVSYLMIFHDNNQYIVEEEL